MVNKKFTLKEAYVKSLLTNYFAQVTNEDFENGTAVMDKLHAWISQKTFGKITKILTNPPDPTTLLILVNTLYFKGKWIEPFPKKFSYYRNFTNSDGTVSKVKMMSIRDHCVNYAHNQEKKIKVKKQFFHLLNIYLMFLLNDSN